MNVQVTFDPMEILKNIDRKVVLDYIRNTITDEEKESIGDTVYNANSDLLLRIDNEEIIDYIKDDTNYYMSEDVGELMEQIRVSGSMDEVIELLTIKYEG